ncbi:hypothetical protein E4T56_gene8726 [Termitomyces sp. T112]|nr:hypothetical protein E4T56_gene8726 [Termitomyces sp. T112]
MSSTASPHETSPKSSDPYVAYSRALYNYTLNLFKESTRGVEVDSLPNSIEKTNYGETKKNETMARTSVFRYLCITSSIFTRPDDRANNVNKPMYTYNNVAAKTTAQHYLAYLI